MTAFQYNASAAPFIPTVATTFQLNPSATPFITGAAASFRFNPSAAPFQPCNKTKARLKEPKALLPKNMVVRPTKSSRKQNVTSSIPHPTSNLELPVHPVLRIKMRTKNHTSTTTRRFTVVPSRKRVGLGVERLRPSAPRLVFQTLILPSFRIIRAPTCAATLSLMFICAPIQRGVSCFGRDDFQTPIYWSALDVKMLPRTDTESELSATKYYNGSDLL